MRNNDRVQRNVWPLIGRENLVAAVLSHLADPTCSGVLLIGQSGVGTTRLLDEVHSHYSAQGRFANRVVASRAMHSSPFGALAPAIPGSLRTGDAPLDSMELFERLRKMVGQPRSAVHRFLACVDDIRWLDEASLGLLTQMVVGKLATVVATAHENDLLPDAILTLERGCAIRRITVPPLTRLETLELLDLALAGPVDGTTGRELAEACQGNPLYLAELVDGSVATGVLATVLGTWTLSGPPVITARLSRLLDSQLSLLDAHGRDLIELLAFAEPVVVAALESAGLLPAALALEAAGLLATDPSDPTKVRLVQPLIASQVRARISPLRRHRLLPRAIRLVAPDGHEKDTGTDSGDDPANAVRLALWRLECGDLVSVAELERAAVISRMSHDFETIEELTSAAVHLEPTLNTLLLQAEALFDLCRFDQADEVMRQADALVDDDDGRLRLAIVRHRTLLWGRHDGAASVRALEETIAVLQVPAMRDFARIAIANTVVFSGDPSAVARLAATIEVDGELERCALCFPRAVAGLLEGRLVDAVAVGREGVERRARFPESAPVGHPAIFGLALSMALIDHGSFDEAEPLLADGYTRAVEQHIPQLHVWLTLARGRSLLTQGRLGDARRWFMEARSVADQARFPMGLRIALTGLLACAGQVDDLEGARLIERALRELPDDHGLMWPQRHLGHAWFAVVDGRPSDALTELLLGAAEAAERGECMLQLEMLYEAARVGHARAVSSQFNAVAAKCDGPLFAARGHFVRGVAGGDAVELAAAEKRFAGLGVWVGAAESAAELARVLHRNGRPRDSQGAANRSLQYVNDLKMVVTPMLRHSSNPADLSPREREIALLAAGGVASKAIAQQLGLSVRTVSNHLQNAYLKLGISDRDDIAAAISPVHPR